MNKTKIYVSLCLELAYLSVVVFITDVFSKVFFFLNRNPALYLFNSTLYDSPPSPPAKPNSHNTAEHFTQYLNSWTDHFLFSALQR